MLLARRNLFRDLTRFLFSVLGVAVSVGLILLLAGYRSGVYRQASAYRDNAPGTVVVAERGIRDLHVLQAHRAHGVAAHQAPDEAEEAQADAFLTHHSAESQVSRRQSISQTRQQAHRGCP